MFTDLQLARLCEAVYAPGIEGMPGYFTDESQSVEGMFVETETELVVVFRGTDELADWFHDLDVKAVQWPLAGCWTHEGFLSGYKAVADQVGARVMAASAADKRIVHTGHSYGHGLATDAAQEYGGDLITFGGPNVGNAEFNRRLLHVSVVRRYTNGLDLVTRHPNWIRRGVLDYVAVEHPTEAIDVGSFWTRWTPPWGTVTGRHGVNWYCKALERNGIK